MRIVSVQLEALGVDRADQALEGSLTAIEAAARQHPDLILLPECTWPGYILGSDWAEALADLPADAEVLNRFAAAAAAAAAVVVVGLALTDGGRARNAAAIWGPDGALLGTVDKRFLWDFDGCWFQPGQRSPVLDTPAGRIGVMVCADGRMPEIARSLAVQGAEILLDPTAWLATGPDPGTWTNPQYEYMLPTRARENGASGRRVVLDVLDRPLDGRDLRFLSDLSVDLLVTPRPARDLGPEVPTVALDRPDAALLSGGDGPSARWTRTHGAAAPGGELGRAAENRIHVAVSTPPGARTSSRVLSPAGGVLVDAGSRSRLLLADVAGCEPRRKQMAPGTDVVGGRQPQAYGPVLRAARQGFPP